MTTVPGHPDAHPRPPASRPSFRKTASMRLVEMQFGQPLDVLLPELVHRLRTVEAIADAVGVGYSTVWRWLVQLGLSTPSMDDKEAHRQERERRLADRAPTGGAARRA